MTLSDQKNINTAREYFLRADQGRPDVLELFTQDMEFYFPKFGFATGRESFLEMVKGFDGVLQSIQHDYDSFHFIAAGNSVVVEGGSHGKMGSKEWVSGETPGGRFCNVFTFRDGQIASLHVYLDPDYTGEDGPRFRWGKNRRW